MSFSGDLMDYPLPELLFYLSANRRSGWLTIRSEQAEMTFALSNGQLVSALSDDVHARLGHRLLSEGRITPAQLAQALQAQQTGRQHEALGSSLVRLGFVGAGDVQRVLRAQVSDLLFHILTHPPCRFLFKRGLPDVHDIRMDVALERTILDAVRHADEWAAQRLWSATIHLNLDTSADMLVGVIMDHWPVIDAILDGADTLETIAVATSWPHRVVHDSLRKLQSVDVIFLNRDASQPEHRSIQKLVQPIPADVHYAAQLE